MNTCRHFDLDEAPLSVRHMPEFAPTQDEVHELPAHVIDRLPEAFDAPEPHAGQRRGIAIVAVVLGAVICAVCLAGYREALPW